MQTWCFLGILFSLPHNKADVYVCAASMVFSRIYDRIYKYTSKPTMDGHQVILHVHSSMGDRPMYIAVYPH